MTVDTKKKAYKKLGFTALETVEMIKPLNNLLANYHVHYQKLRNFHWNVKGRDFFELHEKFEELYKDSREEIDEIAERIRVFGQTPVSTMKRYLDISEIKEVGTDLSADDMVRETISDMRILVSHMVNVADAAIDIGDVGTEDLINSYIRKTEKKHWMLSAWLNEAPVSK